MILSDVSVRRPVFATVLSILLVILGLAALANLPVRQYPDVDPAVVSVETTYRGASAQVIETKVTQPIEDQVAGLEGLRKLTSGSRDGRSDIRLEFSLDRDVDEAANDVRDRVGRVVDALPDDADIPEVAKTDSNTRPIMWLNLTSPTMTGLELTDYAERYLIDPFSAVPGVGRVRLSGARRYAMRIWINREALAARGLTVGEVAAALRRENVELPAGRLESAEREFTLRTETGLDRPEDFRRLVLARGDSGELVRLGDVADVRLGAENERNAARANTIPAVSLGIEQLARANTVEVSRGVRARMAQVAAQLPGDMTLQVNYDRATFIDASMREVVKAMGFAVLLVLIVIFVFLGNVRATIVPAVVVPVSIVATCTVMAAFGFSVNTLTLLGLVLAIGLVVDDAIVVLENIYRRIEAGRPALLAALEGSKEIGFAVIATTLVLVSVFVPLSYIQGNIGRLFGEFGITLAAAVIFSSLVALTLTPVMAARLFRDAGDRSGLSAGLDRLFAGLSGAYTRSLRAVLRRPFVALGGVVVVSLAAVALLRELPREYAPSEDRGAFFVMMQAPEGASYDYTDRYAREMERILLREVDDGPLMRFLLRIPGSWGTSGEVNTARAIALLKPWDERDETAGEIARRLTRELGQLPGVRVRAVTPRSLGVRGSDRPVQMVLGGPDYATLGEWRDTMLAAMEDDPGLIAVDSDYDERKPQMRVQVDRDRAASLGVSLEEIGSTLGTMLGSRVVTTYVDRGREYSVILQGEDADRASTDDLTNLYVRSRDSGALVPLANLVELEELAGPSRLNRFDRMRAISLRAGLADGVSLGDALDTLEATARELLPLEARVSWDGESLEYRESGQSLYVTFGFALLVVFLVLAAQFESFRHPLIIMTTVPLAITGALLGLWIFGATINIYSQIGAVMLIGLAAKNGILIVEFANQLRDRGVEFNDAILQSARTRLRPVLMTSMCTAFGAIPLLLATGAGALSRQSIGAVVFFGVTCAVLLTLVVVPTVYSVLARDTRSPEYVSRLIERLSTG